MDILTPQPLRRGDRIVIVSPAGIIKPQLVYKTMPVLVAQGWEPYVCRHAFDRHATYAGTAEARYSDLESALLDPDTRAILCSRGGYGCVQLLDRLDKLPLRDDPKWLIGYSDISALHALMAKHGIRSIHSPMCKHLANFGGKDCDAKILFNILNGAINDVKIEHNPLNRFGEAKGRLYGGNLSVLCGLISTPYDVLKPDTILFIEDIAEPVYKVERMLYTLRLNGTLSRLRGLIVGQFTDYTPIAEGMETMVTRMVSDYNYPVVFGAPIGHVDHNTPLVCSSLVKLTVDDEGIVIKYLD